MEALESIGAPGVGVGGCRSADPLPQSEIKKIADTIYQRFYVIYSSA